MEEQNPKVVLIAQDEQNMEYYKSQLAGHEDLQLEPYFTIHQFKKFCKDKKYSGIIIDIRTLVGATASEREFFSMLWEGFPVLHVNGIQDNGEISCLKEGNQISNLKGKNLLDHFVQKECLNMNPRKVRLYPRKQIFYNIYLYSSEKEDPIKTNLWDISEGGFFAITSSSKPKDDKIRITIKELEDQTSITGTIQWARPWGKDVYKLPGYGVAFEQIKVAQLQEIQKNINGN